MRFVTAPSAGRRRAAVRIVLSHYVTQGLSAALGLFVISALAHAVWGAFAAAVVSVGVVVCIPPDQPAPKRGKFFQLLPAAVLGLPLFFAVQFLHAEPLHLGLLLVPASFFAFLGGAWGKRGLPIAISIMFAMIFSMAIPNHAHSGNLALTCLYFGAGSIAYLVWATLANALLNGRFRRQMLADTLLSLSELMRVQARHFGPDSGHDSTVWVTQLLQYQARLADQLQTARDILLEAPRTLRRQQLAGMLLHVLEMRDHLLVSGLDLETVKAQPEHTQMLAALGQVMDGLAQQIDVLADALLLGRMPEEFLNQRAHLLSLPWPQIDSGGSDHPGMLARGLVNRVGYLNDETQHLFALTRGDAQPDVGMVRAYWQMFVSPTTWSWEPLVSLWHWDAPPLRHATRAALAIGTAYIIGVTLPWGSHDYWILLTIVVVLRGSLAQTLERRNQRVAGTLLGCLLAAALLAMHPPGWILLVGVTLAQAVAHAFAVRRYVVTAVAATLLGLLQAHMLAAGASPTFDVLERLADTLIGAGVAWAFSYVLPSWERSQLPALVRRSVAAQARHAGVALGLGQLQAVDNEPELRWRLARREAYDSLSALVQATQRSLAEPRAVRPPLEPLGHLLTHSYQLLAQLTIVKTVLLRRRGQLLQEDVEGLMQQGARAIETTLLSAGVKPVVLPGAVPQRELTDPLGGDLNPWLLHRMDRATDTAAHVRLDADQVLAELQVGPVS